MKSTTITVSEAARSYAACVNRVHDQNMTLVLLKNTNPVARLEPSRPLMNMRVFEPN